MTVRDNQPRLVRKCWIRSQQKVARRRRQEYKPVQRSQKAPARKPEWPAIALMGLHIMSEPDNLLTPHHPSPPQIGEKQERSEFLARVAGEKEFIRPVEKQYGLLFARYGVPGIAEFGNRHTLCDERIRQHPGIRVARTPGGSCINAQLLDNTRRTSQLPSEIGKASGRGRVFRYSMLQVVAL